MQEVHFGGGEHIRNAAERLVAAAAEYGSAKGKFNGIRLVAEQDATVESILADYDTLQEAASNAYRKSPEGIMAALARESRADSAREKYAAQMCKLPTLDFKNEVAVLDWLCDIQDATDHTAVTTDREAILSTFATHGLFPNVNLGASYRKGDRDNEYRWLVGQALETLKRVAIHSLIHKFAKEWKQQYATETVA